MEAHEIESMKHADQFLRELIDSNPEPNEMYNQLLAYTNQMQRLFAKHGKRRLSNPEPEAKSEPEIKHKDGLWWFENDKGSNDFFDAIRKEESPAAWKSKWVQEAISKPPPPKQPLISFECRWLNFNAHGS